jgi:hypothetical protein
VYQDGVLLGTRTDLNFHNTWGQGNTVPPVWWHMTEGPFFNGTNNVGLGGDLGGAWIWSRYLSQEDVTSLYNEPWGMFSRPTLSGAFGADRYVTLSWQSVTGVLYSIQWTTNLLEGFGGLCRVTFWRLRRLTPSQCR